MKTNFTKFKLIFSAIPVVLILFILTSTAIPQNNINKNIPYGLKQDQIPGFRDANGKYISDNPETDSFQIITLNGGSSLSDAGDVNFRKRECLYFLWRNCNG